MYFIFKNIYNVQNKYYIDIFAVNILYNNLNMNEMKEIYFVKINSIL